MLWLAAAALGCSANAPPTDRPTEPSSELRIAELQREARVGEVEIKRLRREVERLRQELARVQSGSSGMQAERAPASASSVTEEISLADEAIEVEEVEEIDLDDPIDDDPPDSVPPPAPVPTSSAALDHYDGAYAAFHEKRYEEALRSFRSFLELYGRTDLADNAQFWIGACHKALGDPEAALDAFTHTVADYPQGNKVPDALLEAGKCLEDLGELEQARETWTELILQFADSAAALAATERLKNLPPSP